MTVTNIAKGQEYNFASLMNSKLEAPLLQSEMGLDSPAIATKQAVRWDEFSVKHNNDGSFKGIDQGDMSLSSAGTTTKKPVRYDEFSIRHNASTGVLNNKCFKKGLTANPSATNNTWGTSATLSSITNYTGILPLATSIVFGGTFGTETVTVQLTVTYGDTTSTNVSFTATATGTTSLSNSDLMSLEKDGTYISQIVFNTKSSIDSSAATVNINAFGLYL